jgi:hypothetical protein
MLKRRALVLVAALAVTTVACSGGDDTASDADAAAPRTEAPAAATIEATEPASSPTSPAETTTATTNPPTTSAAPVTTVATTTATTTTVPPVARVPLTGVPLAPGESPPDRSAMVVKIDNVGAARPQTGLNQADIVFEEIVEGRATRFAAVFHSQGSNPVGPIRSGRTQDVDLLSGLGQPIFVWSGGNPGVFDAITRAQFHSINNTGPVPATGFFRSNRPKPHNLYHNTDVLWQQLTWAIGRPAPLFSYVEPGAAVAGDPRSWLTVKMGNNPVRWDYDAASDTYLRSQGGAPHQLTDGRATADNVVVLVTDYRPSAVDRRSPEAVTVGRGIAFVMSDGRLQTGVWHRDAKTDPINLSTPEGAPLLIAPGRTWVELADTVDHNVQTG